MELQENTSARIHIWVSGRVQGVGFRNFVQQCGIVMGLSGWVRNSGDDSVEIVAEGRHDRLEEFLEKVQRGPRAARVDGTRIEWEKLVGEFRAFTTRAST